MYYSWLFTQIIFNTAKRLLMNISPVHPFIAVSTSIPNGLNWFKFHKMELELVTGLISKSPS